MDAKQIAELRKLEQAGTVRPWKAVLSGETEDGNCTFDIAASVNGLHHVICRMQPYYDESAQYQKDELDAVLATTARNALPDLLDELERFTAILPCGHNAHYTVNSDEGTAFCALCEMEAAHQGAAVAANDALNQWARAERAESEVERLTARLEQAQELFDDAVPDDGGWCPWCGMSMLNGEAHSADCPYLAFVKAGYPPEITESDE